MDDHQPTPDLKEQFRHAVLSLPIDVSSIRGSTRTSADYLQNPTEYLRQIKRVEGLMLDIEYENMDHNEPNEMRKNLLETKRNVRELVLSPALFVSLACFIILSCIHSCSTQHAIVNGENGAVTEPAPEDILEQLPIEDFAPLQSILEQHPTQKSDSNQPAVEESVTKESTFNDSTLTEPLTEEPTIINASDKKKKRKTKKKKSSGNTTVTDPIVDFFDIPDINEDGLLGRLRTIHLQAIRPKSSSDKKSEEYKAELVNNLSNELWMIKVKVAEIGCINSKFGDYIEGQVEKVEKEVEVDKKQLEGLTDELNEVKMECKEVKTKLKEVRAELKEVKMGPMKFRVELEDITKELDAVRRDFNGVKRELNDTKKVLKDTTTELADIKEELNNTKNELSDVKKKTEAMEKEMEKMGEMYAWYEKQEELAVSHFF